MQITLIEKIEESSDVITFIFKPDVAFSWKAGQYLRYSLPHSNPDNRNVSRYFSISTAPFEIMIGLTTRFAKEQGSSFKNALYLLNIGDSIKAENLTGEFVVEDFNREYVFIAGGIGITPFRSILLQWAHQNKPIRVTLLYANKNEEIIFKDQLEDLAKNNPDFVIVYFIGTKHITEEDIKKATSNMKDQYYYISGPAPMVFDFEDKLLNMKISKERIRTDNFPGYTWPMT
jgi:ferredoxin-NADP reductase